jgi:hypothetical protein
MMSDDEYRAFLDALATDAPPYVGTSYDCLFTAGIAVGSRGLIDLLHPSADT